MASRPSDQLLLRTAAATTSTATSGTVKPPFRNKSSSILTDGIVFMGGAMAALLLLWALWSFVDHPGPKNFSKSASELSKTPTIATTSTTEDKADCTINLRHDPPSPNFYDDPNVVYTVGGGQPMKNWDERRQEWLKQHPSFAAGMENRILLLTGSQPTPCQNPIGDHLLMRFFKNKVDYCRIHGYDIFYNNALFHPEMKTFWAKIPVVKAAMLAHPEAEWIWWMDSDAAFTDMDFKLPLDRYREHNMVVHGYANMIFETKEPSWVGFNAGVFLIRNCQWSMDLMVEWASMGPQMPAYAEWGRRQKSTFKDKLFPESDDQTGLLYLMLKGMGNGKERWAERIYLEDQYYFEGYWVEIVGTLEQIQERYKEMGRRNGGSLLTRRHAEKVSEHYGEAWETHLQRELGRETTMEWRRRPFVTHFTGCQPCNGNHNQMYSGESCWKGMEMALNFADNQVLRSFGFVHANLQNSSSVSPLSF